MKRKKVLCYLLMTVLVVSGIIQGTGKTSYAEEGSLPEAEVMETEIDNMSDRTDMNAEMIIDDDLTKISDSSDTDNITIPDITIESSDEMVDITLNNNDEITIEENDSSIFDEETEITDAKTYMMETGLELYDTGDTYEVYPGASNTLTRNQLDALITINRVQKITIVIIQESMLVIQYSVGEMRSVENTSIYDFSYTLDNNANNIPYTAENEYLRDSYIFTFNLLGTIPVNAKINIYGINRYLKENDIIYLEEYDAWSEIEATAYKMESNHLTQVSLERMGGVGDGEYGVSILQVEGNSSYVFFYKNIETPTLPGTKNTYEHILDGTTIMSRDTIQELITINATQPVTITAYPNGKTDTHNRLKFNFEIGEMVLIDGVSNYDFSFTIHDKIENIPITLNDNTKEKFAYYLSNNGTLPIKSNIRVDIVTPITDIDNMNKHFSADETLLPYGVTKDTLVPVTYYGMSGSGDGAIQISMDIGSYDEYIILYGKYEDKDIKVSLIDPPTATLDIEKETEKDNEKETKKSDTSSDSKAVKTGDTTTVILYAVMMLLALCIIGSGLYYKRLDFIRWTTRRF